MMLLAWLTFLVLARESWSQDEDDGPYRGRLVGKINSYHHQVTGEVYAVDDWTLLLVNFNYDGTGDDTFFWAGDSARPGPQGFIVPDQHGKSNILERYYNEDVRLTLPEGKRVSRLKWFAVYDIASQNAFGDVYVPDEFEAPAPLAAGALAGSGVTSSPLQLLDANTILIPELHYDGAGGEVYFWAGVGPQPSARGFKIPDEYGYLEPLPVYRGGAVRLALPGEQSLFTVDWLALWDARARRALASVLLPERPNVPPALTALHPHKTALPHCRQLHRDVQAAWEVFGNQVTFQLAGKIGANEYIAFGISGSAEHSRMRGADVAVAAFDERQQRGLATDYNITELAPCVQVLGQWRGVCRDDRVGGLDSNQVFTASRSDGVTVVTYRRTLQPGEPMDREWVTDRALAAVWAVGALDAAGEPQFHRLWPRADVSLLLGQQPPENDCFQFSIGSPDSPPAWEVAELFDPALRVFSFRLGPAGGRRGAAARPGGGGAPLAWYVNGQLAPDLQIRRGLQYTFKVFGGNNPHSAAEYHPLIVSAAARGGLEQLPEAAQRAGRVFAGVTYTRRGRLSPTAGGAARGPSVRRRDLHAPRPAQSHRSGPAVPGRARRGRGPAPRRRLRDVPRVQPLARLGLRARRRRRAARRAQRHLARPRLLQLLHARRHGRAHLRGGPAAAQPQQARQQRGGRRSPRPLPRAVRAVRARRARRALSVRRCCREPSRTQLSRCSRSRAASASSSAVPGRGRHLIRSLIYI